MNIVITGGTGLVGKELVNKLKNDHEIIVLTRSNHSNTENITYINWSEDGWEKEMPKKVNAVINLAGASLQKRWTKDHKKEIITSRVSTTKRLFEYFKTRSAPDVLFNASAIGYYTPSKTKTYDESDICQPNDFLSEVVSLWEGYAKQFESIGTRVVIGRFGIIFSGKGGALPLMVKPYKLYGGGPIGDGQQWFSWVHIDDVVHAIEVLISSDKYKGVFNITSVNPITQDQLGRTIALVTNKPHWFKVPKPLFKLILGEQSDMILHTQKVLPKKLLSHNFSFIYPHVEDALYQLIK
ncbi:TIGR01777 family oxidoreductase [Phocicoccus pinnipedialis]|uniref:Epimerase family protein n=1 Tax=Phocicoccus pinnipedialis TaxID=110845 RepID=A0A6V7RAL8_9BACL|nr:TIGR01777 family oxidoreductase [Jeotgalicoccus pinnipedialis]MBP1939874.1 uncharacterized protein (TIGR01777 family) [Jeotgalicoccus pinnipedialis]CAD2074651.1 Epimerase family protein [Jeotgalicoccus pinnipedialis]